MLCTVIGAGPGLGAALVRTFAADGHDVAHVARRPYRVPVSGGRARGFTADVDDPAALTRVLDEITEWAGDTGILIYNAARMVPDDVETLDPDDLVRSMRTNAGAALQAVQHVLPGMRRAGRGTILLTGGGLGLEPYPDWASLGAGKAALRSLGVALHKKLRPRNIHVAVVAIAGILDDDGPLTARDAAAVFRAVHHEDRTHWSREVVHLPPGGDPYYNDPDGVYRDTSLPVRSSDP